MNRKDKLAEIGLIILLLAWFVAVVLWIVAAFVCFPLMIAQALAL